VKVRGFRTVGEGQPQHVHEPANHAPPANPVLRYLAILSAARDFGVASRDIERVACRFDPLTTRPEELADALADTLRDRRTAA
jgi:hypothetical protein